MKKQVALLMILVLMVCACAAGTAEVVQFPGGPVIGIAWRADTDSEFFTNICRAVEEAGGQWVMLDQVCLPDLDYTPEGKLTEGVAETGALDDVAAKFVRCNTWHNSNAAEAVGDVSAVIFTGGEDISSSLYYTPGGMARHRGRKGL